jgi:hypothetical protein
LNKTKNRIINFRVTDEELACLKLASDLHGARCLSDFARTVMLGTAGGSRPTDGDKHIEERISSLDGRLASVESDLTWVINRLSCAEEVTQNSEDER